MPLAEILCAALVHKYRFTGFGVLLSLVHHERSRPTQGVEDEVCNSDADCVTVLMGSFRASPRSIRPIYTGGPVLLTKDGRWLISTMGEEVMVTEVTTGLAVARVRGVSLKFIGLLLAEMGGR